MRKKELIDELESNLDINLHNIEKYFKRNYSPKNCKNCTHKCLVREKGLTLENITIYLKYLRKEGIKSNQYCIGKEEDSFTLCYTRKSLPLINKIQIEIFSKIRDISFCYENKQMHKFNKRYKESQKIWNTLQKGSLSLIKSYKKTHFSNSKDILVTGSSLGTFIKLHGHQIKDFLHGRRNEQKKEIQFDDEPFCIQLGHYHKLGVLAVKGKKTICILSGCSLYSNVCNKFILSEMGSINFEVDIINGESWPTIVIHRGKLDTIKRDEIIDSNIKNQLTFEDKINHFFEYYKDFMLLLPGNHDPFDEVYIKKNIATAPQKLLEGLGDYIELDPQEFKKAKQKFHKFFEENNFIPLGKFKKKLNFNF